jgi:hypothetical protein
VTFLDPFVLLGLAAAAVPLLLHLFNLRRPRTVDFSSLEFLQSLQQRTMQRVRIKQWLLLALRMLAIACLVLAFARPTLTGNLAGTVGQVRTSWALVVDNSLSMTLRDGQGAYLQQAKEAASGILSAMEPDDELFLLTTEQTADQRGAAPYRSPGAAREAVAATESQPGGGTLARSITQAAGRLREATHLNKEMYVLTDAQTSMLADSVAATVPDDVGITLVPVGDREHANVAVTDVRVRSRIVEIGQPVELEATLTNYSTETLDGYVASAYLQGERVAQATATLQPGQSTTVGFTATPQQRGWLAGTVQIEDDAFTPDNVRHFTLNVPEERRLLVVRGDGETTRYIDLALSPELVQGRLAFRTETISENELAATPLGNVDAVILTGPSTLSSGEISTLARYVETGGGLLLFPSEQAQASDYNALFEALGGGRFSGFSGSLSDRQPIAAFDRVDVQHPLFEGVFDRSGSPNDEVQVESPDIYYAMNYSPSGGAAQTLIELSNGFPFMQELRHGSGVALLMAVAAEPQWSDLPVRGLFIPLLYRSVYYLSAGESVAGEQLTVGQPGELRVTGVPETETVRLVGPNGNERTPEQRNLFGATLLQLGPAIRAPGIHDVQAGETLVRRVAFNLDARESDLRTAASDEAASALSDALGHPVRTLDPRSDGASVADTIEQRRVGTEIWNVFLLLALGFLVTEMLVASQWKPESVTA